MKYTIITDENKYLLELSINANGVEVPEEVLTSKHINCWKYVKKTFTFDVEKDAELTKEEAEEEKHEKEISAQTLKLAEMFVDMGIDADTFLSRIDAQVLYSALMTDTLLEDEDVA